MNSLQQFARYVSRFTGVELFVTADAGEGLPWRKDYRAINSSSETTGSNKSIVMPEPESMTP